MNKNILVGLFSLVILQNSYAQTYPSPVDSQDTGNSKRGSQSEAGRNRNPSDIGEVYKLKLGVDIPIIAIGTGWSLYAFTKIYKKPNPTEQEINNLKTSDINGFDRWAVYPYSQKMHNMSQYPFLTSIPLPLLFFLTGKDTRSDFFKLTFLYWETMSVTGLTGTMATYNVDRYRPYTYSTETPMDKRTGHVAKNSFYAGHVQVVATPTFFIAQVFADYHPDSKLKWLFYGGAAAATVTTAYFRLRGGFHFPTDILLGTTTGVLAGILVPRSHRTNVLKKSQVSVLPFSTGDINGLTFTYHFKK